MKNYITAIKLPVKGSLIDNEGVLEEIVNILNGFLVLCLIDSFLESKTSFLEHTLFLLGTRTDSKGKH